MNLSARQYVPTKQSSISPTLNRSFGRDITPPSKKIVQQIINMKKPCKVLNNRKSQQQAINNIDQITVQPILNNYFHKQPSSHHIFSKTKEIIESQQFNNEVIHLSTVFKQQSMSNGSTSASGTNTGSQIGSSINFVRKEEYLSLLNELKKKEEDESNYLQVIQQLKDENRQLLQFIEHFGTSGKNIQSSMRIKSDIHIQQEGEKTVNQQRKKTNQHQKQTNQSNSIVQYDDQILKFMKMIEEKQSELIYLRSLITKSLDKHQFQPQKSSVVQALNLIVDKKLD